MNIREFILDMNVFNVQTTTPVIPTPPVTGLATLVAGSATVAFPTISATSKIFVTAQSGLLNVGAVWVSARTTNTSFTITSTNVLDTRTIAYQVYV